ncbi:FHA domain-containing protein [Actinospica durhamensis]|uniref:FHA domain-containing protein n=1 Tax=Actinospica durhamensis TaxID=1508375 RepID=A0A941EWJ9_9ACTN|nr:FHA domain-containing protein [Actinospica durhamensis]MBR7836304.1 FHA domain-containing protein [Actinospica durhamensis]
MGFEGFGGATPAGTILVVAEDRHYRKQLGQDCEVLFGRGGDDVHLAVGIDDPYVSRRQGLLLCDGSQWRLRNIGKLPIRLVDETMVLTGHELALKTGCTPLLVGAPIHRVHLVEVHVSGRRRPGAEVGPESATRSPDEYELSETERLALVAVGQRYLRQDPAPQPVSWSQAAEDLTRAPGGRRWTARSVEHVVAAIRQRLATGRAPIPHILRGEMPEPVGNTLNHNLITALLRSATLTPHDLALLGEDEEF